ncbi:DUF5627 domain-containing protein [Proteiniphilum sp. X52]|uniref:DUF5627 domain-containing protein n=1 Tax=Proteiniphilum sp. X52 TaxID=2382159 RepID=UPI000F0A82DC|nr:DUF5627 domain-containing protein [Proteiniphilum sp. X52]RNC65582.1 DUF1735 domain-containing protein [Proteiniphilum sp. X52]
MKKIIFLVLSAVITSGIFIGCQNGEWEFPDYEFSAVYFAYQSPIRTICLGEDVFDTRLDNEYKCQIMATMGGVYKNNENIDISIKVDNALCDGLVFDDTGEDILPMPSSYYTLSSDKITIEKGSILGGVTVQLTDAFFNDPKSLVTTYVIPVVMTGVNNADSILSGIPLIDHPRRGVSSHWDVQPKDYVLYAVKYINQYDANYLRRGKDTFLGSQAGTKIRHAEFVEKDEVVTDISTRSLNSVAWQHRTRDLNDLALNSTLLLTFDDSGNCTVTSSTEGILANGTGKFVPKGDKNSWGNTDRDVLYLEYSIDYGDIQCATTDTLVVRDRGMRAEWFTSGLKE